MMLSSGTDYYEIHVRGHLEGQWSAWFDGLTVTPLENGETLIAGWVRDQAALHGILTRLRNLGVPLLRVALIEPQVDDAEGASHDVAHNPD